MINLTIQVNSNLVSAFIEKTKKNGDEANIVLEGLLESALLRYLAVPRPKRNLLGKLFYRIRVFFRLM